MSEPSNLGDSIRLSNLGRGGEGGGRNPPELNNSKFLRWISIKFCVVVGPHLYFWRDWMKDDVTVTSQKFGLLF